MAHKTVRDVHKNDGAALEPSHFFSKEMKKIYSFDTKPHLEYVLKNFPNVYVPKSTPRKAR